MRDAAGGHIEVFQKDSRCVFEFSIGIHRAGSKPGVLDRLPKEIAETSIKDWYDRLNRFKLPDLSAASASQS